ncbi:MAG: NAD-dependent epimerase/dehydratase family protein [Candidatus Aenigmarchaeota archaeon]|nr:NAD-dependent epimerase/dehydratase family protein [Candidatus Aenigmarchaeota archaeon]
MLLVTGGTGFIGTPLVESLLRQGKQVRLLCRDPARVRKRVHLEAVRGDLLDPASLAAACKGVDQVIHLAALISYTHGREQLFQVNVEGTRNLLAAAQAAKVKRIVFASSVAVYGHVTSRVDEQGPLRPDTPYGESKLLAEREILASGIPAVALRIGPVYGEGSQIFASILKMLERGFPVPRVQTNISLVHVSDVVQAFLLALRKGEGPYNIAGDTMPFLDMAALFCKELGIPLKVRPPWLVFSAAKLMGKGHLVRTLTINRDYDCSRAGRELGFAPTARTGSMVTQMVASYKAHPPERRPD